MALSQNARQLLILGVAIVIAGGVGTYAYYGVFKVNEAIEAKKQLSFRPEEFRI